MQPICESIQMMVLNLKEAGTGADGLKDLLGKLIVAVKNKSEQAIFDGAVGHMYELFRLEDLREKEKYKTLASKGTGDLYYQTPKGTRTSQLKWVTGRSENAPKTNLQKAMKQLKGYVDGNDEKAAAGSKPIADIVLQNNSINDKMLQTILNQLPTLDAVSIRIIEIKDGSITKSTYELQSGHVVTKVSDNVFKLSVLRGIHWTQKLAEEASAKRPVIVEELNQIRVML